MTRNELIEKIAQAIAEMEGFYRTAGQPALAQRNANPGNIRQWRDSRGRPYPTSKGYVDFVAWASERFPGLSREEMSRRAIEEGWRVLRVLIGQYLDGRYTQGKPPTVDEMFRVYAPSGDGNHPANYARFVARKLGAPRPKAPRSGDGLMPGSVQNAAPLTVLPASLSRAFVHEREYPVLDNEYRNGESQRSVQAANSRKRWRLAKRLTPSQLVTLRDFYEARKGPTEPFYFYDPYETSPKFSHDPTGQAVAGRYTVRFAGPWEQSASLSRIDLSLELIELA